MTSSNGNIFHVTGHLRGNSPIPGEFPVQRPVTRSYDVFFICVWINGWVNNREAGDLRHCDVHYEVIVMERFRSKQKSHYFSPVLRTSLTTAFPSRVQMYRKISLGLYSYMSKVVCVVKLYRQKHKKYAQKVCFLVIDILPFIKISVPLNCNFTQYFPNFTVAKKIQILYRKFVPLYLHAWP